MKKKQNVRYYQYSSFLLLSSFIPLIFIGTFNYFIDPYGIFNAPTIKKINLLKPKQDGYQRLIKSADIIKYKPKIIFLGSSTVLEGLNPQHKVFTNRSSAYNLGVTSANMHEIKLYFDHLIINSSNIEEIVLGLNFFMFNQNKNNQMFIEDNVLLGKNNFPISYTSNLLLSIDTLKVAVATIVSNQNNTSRPTHYYSQGMRLPYLNSDTNTRNNLTKKDIFEQMLSDYINARYFYGNYQLSQKSLAELKYIVEQCKENNIKLTVFISPLHSSHLEAIEVSGLWSVFEQWKIEVSNITEVWDFADYHEVNREKITEDMQYFNDSIHYSPKTGDLILNQIFASSQDELQKNNFGTFVDKKNIKQQLKKVRKHRQKWIENNPDTYNWVQSLKKEKD